MWEGIIIEKLIESVIWIAKRILKSKKVQSWAEKRLNKRNTIDTEKVKGLTKYLSERGFKSTSLSNNLSIKDGYVIWPITLQPSATYIHTAQIQLIKLLVCAGWKLHVIIGDCGKHSATAKASDFQKEIQAILNKNEIPIKKDTITLLSKYYQRNKSRTDDSLLENVTSLELLNTFHRISNSVEWEKYWNYVTKNYDKKKIAELKKRKILSNIQPLLNWTLVITITKKYSKTIVVAGEDEKEQWDKITNLHGNNKIGMIYIQELKDEQQTMDQSEIGIGSEQEMLAKLNKGNMASWLYSHFIELPYFLKDDVQPSFCKLSSNECQKNKDNCIKCLFDDNSKNFKDSNFDKNAFVSEVYQIANPANAIS
jgi:hypothetical protein